MKFQRDIVDIYQMEPRQTVDDIKGHFGVFQLQMFVMLSYLIKEFRFQMFVMLSLYVQGVPFQIFVILNLYVQGLPVSDIRYVKPI